MAKSKDKKYKLIVISGNDVLSGDYETMEEALYLAETKFYAEMGNTYKEPDVEIEVRIHYKNFDIDDNLVYLRRSGGKYGNKVYH